MLGNTFGRMFRITTCGESYSGGFRKDPSVPSELYGGQMVIIDGVPAGLKITAEKIEQELDKRRPGLSKLSTPRKEKDRVFIFSGVMENDLSTGAPVGMIIPNSDIDDKHIQQHKGNKNLVRPGQASYTYYKKYGKYYDWAGAGRASARETVARVAGGAVAKIALDAMGIDVIAYTVESHGIKAAPVTYETAKANYRENDINCPDLDKAQEMIDDLLDLKAEGDSCGGVIEIIAKGVPAGLGEPVFDKLSAMIAHAMLSIGSIKGVEFGDGFELARLTGSQSNDTPYIDGAGKLRFRTNRAGGMLGGISNGEEIRVRVAAKPIPTILKQQDTADLVKGENVGHVFASRSDPSALTRLYPVCEAMMRMVLLDAVFMYKGYSSINSIIDPDWEEL